MSSRVPKVVNSVHIEGEVAWEPRTNYTGNGQAVANFALKVPTLHGQGCSTIRCVAWGNDCEFPADAGKGSFLRVDGRLVSQRKGKDSEEWETVVACDAIEDVRHKGNRTSSSRPPAAPRREEPPPRGGDYDDDIPF